MEPGAIYKVCEEAHHVIKVYMSGRVTWGDGQAMTPAQLSALEAVVAAQYKLHFAVDAFKTQAHNWPAAT